MDNMVTHLLLELDRVVTSHHTKPTQNHILVLQYPGSNLDLFTQTDLT